MQERDKPTMNGRPAGQSNFDDGARSPLGPLPKKWQMVTLGAIALKVGSGATPKGGSSAYLPSRSTFALIRSQNVFDRRFDETGLAFITDDQARDLRSSAVEDGDLLLNITGDGVTFGRACRAPTDILPACVNQHVAIIRVDESRCDPGFLLSFLTHPFIKGYIESFNAGGSRRAITKGHIEAFRVPLPPLKVQRAIAAILGALDDKIELNRRMNRTLEAMAQALFQSWFVDFDPVRAKMAGRQPAGMDAETATMFPDRLESSARGDIPAGWTWLPLTEIATFLNGLALQNYPPIGEESLPVIKIAEMRNDVTSSSGRATANLDPKYVVTDGDVLFSWSGSLEAIIWTGGRGALNQHLFKVMSSQYPRWFCYSWIRQYLPEFRAIAAGKATTMGHIQRHHLVAALALVPPSPLLGALSVLIEPMLNLAVHCQRESRSLVALRDSLLPKLLTGELCTTASIPDR
jgi:type I restriction enzyme S subunit